MKDREHQARLEEALAQDLLEDPAALRQRGLTPTDAAKARRDLQLVEAILEDAAHEEEWLVRRYESGRPEDDPAVDAALRGFRSAAEKPEPTELKPRQGRLFRLWPWMLVLAAAVSGLILRPLWGPEDDGGTSPRATLGAGAADALPVDLVRDASGRLVEVVFRPAADVADFDGEVLLFDGNVESNWRSGQPDYRFAEIYEARWSFPLSLDAPFPNGVTCVVILREPAGGSDLATGVVYSQ